MTIIAIYYLDRDPPSIDRGFIEDIFSYSKYINIIWGGTIKYKTRLAFQHAHNRVMGGSRSIKYYIDQEPKLGLTRAMQKLRADLGVDYLFGISKRPLPEGEYRLSDDKSATIISTYGWKNEFSPPSFEMLLVKELIAVGLATLTKPSNSPLHHSEVKGCIFDSPTNKKYLSAAMWGRVCGECDVKLRNIGVSRIRVFEAENLQKLSLLYHYNEAKNRMNKPNVFISYANEDRKHAEGIREYLKNNGVNAWIDVFELHVGEKWESKIKQQLTDSDFIIICLSQKSVKKRGFVQVEFKEAIKISQYLPENIPYILPVKLDDCVIPTELEDIHFLDLSIDKDSKLSNLLTSIQVHHRRKER